MAGFSGILLTGSGFEPLLPEGLDGSNRKIAFVLIECESTHPAKQREKDKPSFVICDSFSFSQPRHSAGSLPMRRTNMQCVTTPAMVIRQVMVHVRATMEAIASCSHARLLTRHKAILLWRARHTDAVATRRWPSHGSGTSRLICFADVVLPGRMKPAFKPVVLPASCKRIGRC